ncbi:MAG: STAS domain-containing protein [Acidimicrobiales bacterium]
MPSFTVCRTERDGVPVIEVHGEVDLATSPLLHRALVSAAEATAPVTVLDMSDVSLLDSTGLGALVLADERFRHHGGELRVVITQPIVRRVFEITELNEIFAIFSSLTAAMPAADGQPDPVLV